MTTPNMGLTVPAPTVTVGPDYAIDVNADLTIIDDHDHTGGGTGGKQLGAAALLIDGDVAMNNHNLGSIRGLRLQDQGGTLVGGSDIREIYANGPDLYYNNASGVAIKITSGGALNTGVTSTVLNGKAISTGTTILSSDPYTLYQVDTSSAGVTIVLPLASAVGRGRWYVFVDVNGTTPTHSFTVQRSGGDTVDGGSVVTCVDAYGGYILFSDGTSQWNAVRLPAGTLTLTEVTATDIKLGGAQPSTTGNVRLNATASIRARNAGNSGNIDCLIVDGADNVTVGDTTNTASATLTCKSGGTVTCAANAGAVMALTANCAITATAFSATGSASAAMTTTNGGSFGTTTSAALMSFNGVARVKADTTGLLFYGAGGGVAQQTRAGQLTGASGSTGTAIVDVGAAFSQSTLNNNFRALEDAYNRLETIIHTLGLST